MKVIICGAGQVGWQIARHLSRENNDVTIVDHNAALIARAMDTLDVQGTVGHASYPDVLARAGAGDADMIIAATHSDEVNIVTCQVAHSMFSVTRKIARLRAQSYLDAIYADLFRRDHMPIDVVISPEREVAQAVINRLQAPSSFDIERFMDDKIQLLGLQLDDDCPVVNTPLRQLNDLFPSLGAMVAGVRRADRLFVPGSGDALEHGDQVYVFARSSEVNRTLEAFGKPATRQERVVILGGGNVGLAVAQALENQTDRVRAKVIEFDRAVAERAADALERTVVLHGDGMNSELLNEAGVSRADAILALTDDDKVNLLASVRAKAAGCQMSVSLINDPSLVELMSPLDIDAFINPRSQTVSSILRHIRHGKVRDVYSLGNAEAEVIEAQVLSTSSIAGKTIRDIDFPDGALVGAIMKDGELVKPTGATLLSDGDVVILFCLSEDVPEVERLLQVTIDFF